MLKFATLSDYFYINNSNLVRHRIALFLITQNKIIFATKEFCK